MKICIVGAGAIGGLIGAKLALAGEEVTLIARGAHLEALRQNGLKFIDEEGHEHVAKNVKATNKLQEAGAQDIVVLALKAHQVEAVAKDLASLYGPNTVVVTMQNGVPWWYFQKLGGAYEGRRVETVDPNGTLLETIDTNRLIGSVVYPAADVPAPGVIRHIEGNRFSLGELDGSESDRIKLVSQTFIKGGFKAPVIKDIRSEIWLKLWGNLSFNPISALTHATLVDICQFPLTRNLAAQMMTEAQTIATKLGVEFKVSLEKRIAGAEKVGKHKTSMLQDVEAGRAIEIDALVGSVVEMGRLTETPTPYIDAIYSAAKLLAKTLADEKGRLMVQPLG